MNETEIGWKLNIRWLKAGALGFVVTLCLATILYLGINVSEKIQDQTTAASDNVQWTLAQMEVEYLVFELAAKDAATSDEPDLKDLRRKFDVLYSRMNTAADGVIYGELRDKPQFRIPLGIVVDLLDRSADYIDMDDASLLANLGTLHSITSQIRPSLRMVTLGGIAHFATLSDRNRLEVLLTLSRVAGLTVALVMALIILAIVLFQLYRVALRAATENRQTNARLKAMVSSTLDAVIVADSDGHILDYNGAAELIFGFKRDEAIGADMVDLIIPQKYRKAHIEGMKRFRDENTTRVVGRGRVQLEALRKNGEVFPVEFSIAEAKSDNRQIFVSFLRDISAQVESELELLAARDEALAGEKAKADLLAVMSHEMRTPLNGMLGTMELLRDSKLTKSQRNYLRIMETSGKLLLHHVNDVLEISRLDAGPVVVEQSPFSIETLLEEVIESQDTMAKSNDNNLEMEIIGTDDTMVMGDPIRLRQILLNLISNAIKFTHNGTVRIEAEKLPTNDDFEFRIIDTGIGITEENIQRVFDDFVTVDTSYARVSGGTGLGLGITRRLVETLNGEIGAESEQGEGSIFWFRLAMPFVTGVSSEESASHELSLPDHSSNDALEVLVVEDNQINRVVVEEMLVLEGHNVTLAHDGLEGTRIANTRAFDLILMDISMPLLDGVEASRTIRASNGPSANTRIVALTAHALPNDIKRFRDAGMDDALIKPISRVSLNRMLESKTPQLQQHAPQLENDARPLIDFEMLADLQNDLGHERVAGLVAAYIDETDTTLNNIFATRDTVAVETLISEIHKLAGSSAMFGAASLGKMLRKLETLGKTNKADKMISEIPKLQELWTDTREAYQNRVLTLQE